MDDCSSVEKCFFDVSVLDLLNFGGPNMMRNGDQVYRSSHLLSLGVLSKGVKTCIIEGQCLQSSHPRDPPHTITIYSEDSFKDWKFYCSCKAGNGGRCKHVYAALLHINIEKSLEFLTSTEHKQYWGKVAKKVADGVLEPSLIKDLQEMKLYQSKTYELTTEEFDFCKKTLFSGN